MKTTLEVFFTKISSSQAEYLRHSSDLSSETGDPDKFVRETLEERFPDMKLEDCIIHSTSWHFQPEDEIILTYIVYSEKLQLPDSQKVSLADLQMADSQDPSQPRPENMDEKAVFAHGLSHLSFLVKTDSNFQKRISPETKETLEKIGETLAGRI